MLHDTIQRAAHLKRFYDLLGVLEHRIDGPRRLMDCSAGNRKLQSSSPREEGADKFIGKILPGDPSQCTHPGFEVVAYMHHGDLECGAARCGHDYPSPNLDKNARREEGLFRG